MGSSKAMLPFGPELMLERVVRLVQQVVPQVVVVAAPGQEIPKLPPAVQLAHDHRPGRGPLEGLYAGLTALPAEIESVYATSCDAALLVPAFVERLFELLGDHDVVVPIEGKFHHPLSAVYRRRVTPHIEQLLAADRLRPVMLFDEVATLRVPVDQLTDVDPQLRTLRNLNRPEDYQAALKEEGFIV